MNGRPMARVGGLDCARHAGRVWRALTVCLALVVPLAAGSEARAVPVEVTITVDNAYGFGFGDYYGINTYYGGLRNLSAGDIYSGPPVLLTSPPAAPNYTNPGVGPELYQINPVSLDDYAYIVAWSDDTTWQGAFASFLLPGNNTLFSGEGYWEVYATGRDRDSTIATDTITAADIPTLVNPQILIGNAGAGGAGTSERWVDEFGLDSSSIPGVGVLATAIPSSTTAAGWAVPIGGAPASTKWMWYNEDPAGISDPFVHSTEGSDGHNEFLIFRLRLGDVPEFQQALVPEPSALVLAGIGLAALLGATALRRRRSTEV